MRRRDRERRARGVRQKRQQKEQLPAYFLPGLYFEGNIEIGRIRRSGTCRHKEPEDAHRQRGALRGGGRLHLHKWRRLARPKQPPRTSCSPPPSPTSLSAASARTAHLQPVQAEEGGQRGAHRRRGRGAARGATSPVPPRDGVPGAAVPVGAPGQELRHWDIGVSWTIRQGNWL